MNVAIYGKYNGNYQIETVKKQINKCKQYAKENGYNVVGEYIDFEEDRDFLFRLLEETGLKKFKTVIIYSEKNLSKNRYDSAIYKTLLYDKGIRVLYVTENVRENITDDASGIFMESVLKGMAEYMRQGYKQREYGLVDKNGDDVEWI